VVVGGPVLAEQHDLSSTLRHRRLALGADGLKRHVLLAASDPRDYAERAVVVAALDDPDVVADASSTRKRERFAVGVVVSGLEAGDEVFVLSDRHDRIEVRKAARQLSAFFRDDAAGHGDRALWRLPLLQLVELGVHAILRRLAHDAGVENRDVSSLERVFDVTGSEEPSREALGIRRVHLASDRPDVERPGLEYGHRRSPSDGLHAPSSPSIST